MSTPSAEQLSIAPWMRFARAELGVGEVKGVKHSPRILEYLASCDGGARPWFAKDETSWCAAFVAWCLHQASIASTRNLAARSYLRYGDALSIDQVRYGDILVFWRGIKVPATVVDAPGHVAFFERWYDSSRRTLVIHGGNQGNHVSIESRPVAKLLAVRRPSVADLQRSLLMASNR